MYLFFYLFLLIIIIIIIIIVILRPGGSKDILIGFQRWGVYVYIILFIIIIIIINSLVDYLSHETDSQKTELLSSLIYPLFVNCYISLLTSNDADSGI